MAKTEVQSKKRKGAAEPSVSIAKKVKTTPEKSEKSKTLRSATKTTKEAPAPVFAPAAEKKTAKPARKRAEDFLEDKSEKPAKKAAPAKKTTTKVVEKASEPAPVKESAASKTKGKKAAAKPVEKEVTVTVDEEEEGSDDDDQEDDQTAALLAGFDSSEDENDPEDDDNKGVPMDKLPAIPDEKNTRKQLKSAEKDDADNKPGVLYVGRIPHGFFEHQMKAYFSQFGDITHLRLSRNKVTGRSKHYAFIEFASASVADIVAKTMDKYLLFGHILQVRRIPDDQVHAQLWKGEGRRFKVMPRNKIEGGLLNKGKTREQWEKKIKKEEQKREKQAAKLKEIGYEFDMPALKSVDDVPMKDVIDGEGAGLLDGGEIKAILEKQPEAEKVEVEAEKPEASEKAKVTAGTKRVKAKGDGKKAKKAKVAA